MAGEALPQAEYEEIYARVPRLTVEVVAVSGDAVLLVLRRTGPCRGLWHLPGGTVRFGEPLVDAVHRVAAGELGAEVTVDRLLGYIEYPSHLERGIDWPVGIAFAVRLVSSQADPAAAGDPDVGWFRELPDAMHEEQKTFLRAQGLCA